MIEADNHASITILLTTGAFLATEEIGIPVSSSFTSTGKSLFRDSADNENDGVRRRLCANCGEHELLFARYTSEQDLPARFMRIPL